jgi:HEPN domain-containing protein
MNTDDVREWLQIADDDFDSAQILNKAVRKHNEIICYLCAQAAEKYLKGYLIYYDIIPRKTHNLLYLNELCAEIDTDFQKVLTLSDSLNKFANDVRYPHKYDVTESDVNVAIGAVEKIRSIRPIVELKNSINTSTLPC